MDRSFADHAQRVAVRVLRPGSEGALEYQPISYAELKQLRDQLAVGLAGRGLIKGQRVGILTDGGFEPLLVFLACDRLGLSSVPLCIKTSTEILAHNINHSGMALLVVDRKGLKAFYSIKENLQNLPELVLVEGEELGVISWSEVTPVQGVVPRVEVGAHDEAKVLYTSGSSGMPKGVVQTHANIVANVEEVWDLISEREDFRFFKSAPDYHSMGILNIYFPLAKGWVLDMARSPDRVLSDIRISEPQGFLTVPLILDKVYGNVRKEIQAGGAKGKLVQRAVESKQRATRDCASLADRIFLQLIGNKVVGKIRQQLATRVGPHLELLVIGSAKADPEALDFFHEVLDIKTFEGYGTTECAPLIAANHLGGRKVGTVGRPLISVRIVSEQGEEIGFGDPAAELYRSSGEQAGELWASGANVMRGYLDDAEQTARALIEHEGAVWYRTGDLFSIDGDGFLTFRGRVGRQFKLRNGEFVNPELLERIFARAPLVEHVLIYGDQQRDFPLPLVVVDVEEARKCAPDGLASADDSELRTHPEIGKRVRAQLLEEARQAGLPGHERPQRIVLLPAALSEEEGTLTRGLKKVVPKVIMTRYNDLIEAAYSG
ncbi:MAG: long-chain acyl-CoA synthetase [Candidatus Latescibacterota bacterium]|jgi:long-chain acyl-CoA synthetase